MKTSISEIKQFLQSRRNWYWSGRNALYLREKHIDSPALRLGSAFHDALENMYQERPVDTRKLTKQYKLADEDKQMLIRHLTSYKSLVLPGDLERYEIIEPEMRYSYILPNGVELFGFVDIVYRNKENNQIGALEHKYMSRPRSDRYNESEEQVRAYEIALRDMFDGSFDGAILNQVIKDRGGFRNIRSRHKMNEAQREHFIQKLVDTTEAMKIQATNPIIPYSPHFASLAFDPYYDLNRKMDLLGTDDTRVITKEDIERAGLISRHEEIS